MVGVRKHSLPPFLFLVRQLFMALVNVSKGSKVLRGHFAFLLPTAGQDQLLPLFPVSKWMLLILTQGA